MHYRSNYATITISDKTLKADRRREKKMKFKTTKSALKNGYSNIKSCGYCDLQALLQYHDPIAYNSGTYGWNFDVYFVYGVAICTGYRGMVGERLQGIQEFEKKAMEIQDFNIPYSVKSWEVRKEETEKLLEDFCNLNK